MSTLPRLHLVKSGPRSRGEDSYLRSKAPLLRATDAQRIDVDEAEEFLAGTPGAGVWFDTHHGSEPVYWVMSDWRDPYSAVGTVDTEAFLRLQSRGAVVDKEYPAPGVIWEAIPTEAAVRRFKLAGESK